jgi:hypothetical protein
VNELSGIGLETAVVEITGSIRRAIGVVCHDCAGQLRSRIRRRSRTARLHPRFGPAPRLRRAILEADNESAPCWTRTNNLLIKSQFPNSLETTVFAVSL